MAAVKSASNRLARLSRSKKCMPSAHILRRHAYTSSQPEHRDIVIVGGGPAGLALANALGSSQLLNGCLKVSLVEAGDLNKIHQWELEPTSFSNRVSSITNASRKFLTDVGAWELVDGSRTCPIEEMQVWDGMSGARMSFSASDFSSSSLGTSSPPEMARLVENLNLQKALLRRIYTSTNVELLDNTKVLSISPGVHSISSGTLSNQPLVHLSSGQTLRTQLLVGADGFNSPVRTYAGISSYGWAYDTNAIVATLHHFPRGSLEPPNNVAYQRFLTTGPIAFLPLSDSFSSLVWSTKPDIAQALKNVQPDVLVGFVNAAFRLSDTSLKHLYSVLLEGAANGQPLSRQTFEEELQWRESSDNVFPQSAYSSLPSSSQGGMPPADVDMLPPLVQFIQTGTVASFPLRYSHADQYLGEGPGARTVLIGDAAHTIHPLAGQGLNLGMGDAEALLRCIEDAVSSGADIGSYTTLQPYARSRYLTNHIVMSAVDKLHKLYSINSGPVVWARSIGVEVLNELDTLKAAMMMTAGVQADIRATNGWIAAGRGWKSAVDAIRVGKLLGRSLASAASSQLRDLADRARR